MVTGREKSLSGIRLQIGDVDREEKSRIAFPVGQLTEEGSVYARPGSNTVPSKGVLPTETLTV